MSRNTLRYKIKPDEDDTLRKRLRELAEERRRFGCRRLHVMLQREGKVINHKRTERIYREEKLALKIRRRKKMSSWRRVEMPKAKRINEKWAMDFMYDALGNGRWFRVLPVVDTYTKECLRIEVDTSINGKRVSKVLSEISLIKGLPENIVVDNGPEFISNALDHWAYSREVKLHFIRPGKPVDNAFIKSFNARFRNECLNENWFMSMEYARRLIEDWRVDYNEQRLYSSLGDLTPNEFVQQDKKKC